MSFFSNIFGTTSSANGSPITPPNATAQSAATTQNATTVTPTVTPPANENVSPMDAFKDIWQTPSDTNVDTTLPSNMFAAVDPAKMLESARKVDFAKTISPEVLSKITAGGPEAAQAFAAAMNDVSQRAYAQSSFAATKIVEQALTKFEEGMNNRLPGQVKKLQVSESLRESNPALSHPAAAPIVEALQAQFTVKYPNASATEIRQMATDYLTGFAGAVLPKPAEKATPASEDWEGFFK